MFRFSYFSWIRSVLFSFMSGSGLSDLWPHFFVLCPAPVFRIYDPFEFRFVCFVSRSKVKKFDDQACPFFVHVRSFGSMTSPPHELYILTIPVLLFHIILCCFRSNFGSSVLCPVYMYCVLYLAFLHVAIFFLFAVLPGFCLSVLAMYFVLSSTLQTPPFLLNWYQNKVHVTPSVPFHLHCSVVCPDILSTVHIIRILCPICICEGGGGVREGHGWLRLVLWCS